MSTRKLPVSRFSPPLLSVMRIAFALAFLQHGTQKLFNYPPGDMGAVPVGQLLTMMGIAGILETVGGALLLAGLFTRTVAFLLSGQMAVAYFLFHAPRAFFPIANGGELAMLYCFAFLYLVAAGPGPFSVDHALARHRMA